MSVISSPSTPLRVNSAESRMERLGKPRHRRQGRRLSEAGASESNLSMLRVSQDISAKIGPAGVQAINEADFLRSRPSLQLRFTGDRSKNIRIILVVDKLLALVFKGEAGFNSLSVLPSSARQPISHPNVKNRVIAIRQDVNAKIVITRY